MLLILVALAYSAAVMSIGRRQPRPASITAYGDSPGDSRRGAAAPDPPRSALIVLSIWSGAGRLLVHLAFMTVLCGLFVTIALATQRWAWRQQLAIGGAGVLTVLFVVLWATSRPRPAG